MTSSLSQVAVAALGCSLLLTVTTPAHAKPKQVSNGCTAEQIQSSAASQCINQMQDDILHNRATYHAVYCSSTGKMLCCQYDQAGNTVDHSCDIISTRFSPGHLDIPFHELTVQGDQSKGGTGIEVTPAGPGGVKIR